MISQKKKKETKQNKTKEKKKGKKSTQISVIKQRSAWNALFLISCYY